jgi:hypothetical protein
MNRRAKVLAVAVLAIAARPYEDTQHRFRLDLAPGWELAPRFGDTLGMVFEKTFPDRHRSGLALFMVRIAPPGTAGTKTYAGAIERAFESQPGYRSLGEQRTRVGVYPGFVRRYRMNVADGAKLEKRVEAHFFEAEGRIFLVHVEGGSREMEKIGGDVRAMLASFVAHRAAEESPDIDPPDAPRSEAQASRQELTGRFVNADGLMLTLDDGGTFSLADVTGTYEVQGDQLSLITGGKRQSFRFALGPDGLELTSPKLPKPIVYRRAPKATPRTAGDVVGSWQAMGADARLDLEANGRFRMGDVEGTWSLAEGRLRLEKSPSEVITYDVERTGDRLILSGADLDRPATFQKR